MKKQGKKQAAFNEKALRAAGELFERQTVALERIVERLDALIELAREAGRQ